MLSLRFITLFVSTNLGLLDSWKLLDRLVQDLGYNLYNWEIMVNLGSYSLCSSLLQWNEEMKWMNDA